MRDRKNRPHGYVATPDDNCLICDREADAYVHSDDAQARLVDITPRQPGMAVKWADMTAPQRFVSGVFLAGCAVLFACVVAAVCAHVIAWGLG